MKTQTDKSKENKRSVTSTMDSQIHSGGKGTFQFTDKRPESSAQQKLQELANKHTSNQTVYQRAVMSINPKDPNVAKNVSTYMGKHEDEEFKGIMVYEDGELKGMKPNTADPSEILRIIGHGGHLDTLVSHDQKDIDAKTIAKGISPKENNYKSIELIACRSHLLAKKLAMLLPDTHVTGYDGSVTISGSGKPKVYDKELREYLPDSKVRYTWIRRGDEISHTMG